MMPIDYSVQPFSAEIVAAYRRLFPESATEKSDAQLSWRFERGPHGPGLFAVARAGGDRQIVGMIALVATRLRIGSTLQSAYQAIDTVVDPAFRGRGVFIGLGQAAQDGSNHDGRIIWGFPNANAASGWFGRLGWQNFGTVPFMVRPLRSGYFLRKLLPFLGSIDVPLARQRKATATQIIKRFGDDADDLWNASRATDGIAVERNADWLNWRLLDRPNVPYRSVGSYDPKGGLEAFVSTCSLNKHGGNICYVMEAMSPLEKLASLAVLLRDEVARAARRGAEVALAWCPQSAPNRAAYRRAGFLPLPNLVRPVEIHFGARALVPQVDAAIEDGSKWFISYLDSDTV